MAKLPPPYIEGSIPAQTSEGLKIPFRLNRAVSIRNVQKMYAKIKTVATDSMLGVLETTIFSKSETEAIYTASFEAPYDEDGAAILTPGQFYKIQLAFGDEIGDQGYFSTVGVFKYTTMPDVYIQGMKDYEIGNLYTYTGVYDQSAEGKDSTEKEYNYQFDVYQNDNLFASSGLLLHDSTTDTEMNKSSNTWVLNQQLQEGVIYTLYYTVNTMNGITKKCQYNITNNEIEDEVLTEHYNLIATNDFDNGRVLLTLKAHDDAPLTGGFVVSRASSKDNYATWNEVMKFTLLSFESLPEQLWIDYTVEQGIGYQYAIQRFNDSGFYSAKVLTKEPLIADFEDMFLYDGTRQLKIRFNPKVSSFKTNVLETKSDTIGGKYPFFFRNGDVKYKEFPISGMISHLSDEDELFMSAQELGLQSEVSRRNDLTTRQIVRTTQVDTQNLVAERAFKLQVLDWLTNGDPKIFRSPGEGNYIVRLMNTSLTPNDTLSRMIHTFSSTAYEIAEFTFDSLISYGFVENHTIDNRVMAMASVDLTGTNYHTQQNYLSEYPDGVYHAEFVGVQPGTLFHLKFLDGNGTISIRIPNNGYYNVNIFDAPLMSVQCVSIPEQFSAPTGHIDVGYYTTASVGDFSPVRKISVTDQMYYQVGSKGLNNIIESLENVKYKVGHIYYLKAETREDVQLYYNSGSYYLSRKEEDGEIYYNDEVTEFSPQKLYWVFNHNDTNFASFWWFSGDNVRDYKIGETVPQIPQYILTIKLKDNDDTKYQEQQIHLNEYNGGLYTIYDLDAVEKLSIDDGLVLEMMYQYKEYIYGIEEDDKELAALKESNYEEFLKELANRVGE